MMDERMRPVAASPDGRVVLNQRQLFLVFLGGLIVVSLAFMLGVMTGQKMAGVAQDQRAALDDLDREAAGRAAGLTTGPGAVPTLGPGTPAAQALPAAGSAKSGAAQVAATAAAASAPPAPGTAKAPPAPAAPPTAAATPAGGTATEAVAEEIPPHTATSGKWTLQVASLPDQAAADKEAKKLKAQGFAAEAFSLQVKNQTRYRVRIGRFETKEAAEFFKQFYEKRTGKQVLIVTYQ